MTDDRHLHGADRVADEADVFHVGARRDQRRGHRQEGVGLIGNAVGAMKVSIVGHRKSVEKVPLVKYLQTLLK